MLCVCMERSRSISPAASMFQSMMWSCPEAILTVKQGLFMHVLCSGAGNKKTVSFCCTPLKATLHPIAAKSLPNWIIQSSPIAAVSSYLCVCNNQISVEARRVVLSETLSSSTARRLFSLKTILLIKRGVTVERGSEEHRLFVQLFVPC